MILAVEGGSTASCMGLHSRHETTTSIISKSTLLHMDITKNHSSLFVAYTELSCLQRTTYCSQLLRGSMRRQTVTLLVGAPFCRPFLLSPMFLVRLPNVLINRFQRSAGKWRVFFSLLTGRDASRFAILADSLRSTASCATQHHRRRSVSTNKRSPGFRTWATNL